VLTSAALAGLYGRGGWLLGFVAFVPWLRVLDTRATLGAALLSAWGLSVAYTAAVFFWFGGAIGLYTGHGTLAGLAVLLLAAPLFQPQFLTLALVRRHSSRSLGRWPGAAAGIAAWSATEALVPRVLDDSFGYGLYPSALLRQAADLGGVAGLTVLLLLINEAVAGAWARRRDGVRASAPPLVLAALVPLLLAAYGLAALSARESETPGQALRLGLVQSNITDYERLRREHGAGAVVREVLDTHYAMSHDAVEKQRVHAVLWSETVYPTTFGQPKSAAGAALDREIVEIVNAAGVPFVFGTYDRDFSGEYNAAAFVAPGDGIVGVYRKTRPFPLSEHVPAWLDFPALRGWLPWLGSWQPGNGARVLPLRLADGREIAALPLICLDAMDTGLVVDGARLGAQVILTMSNDSWFSQHPLGAELHLAAAAFRSIETRLPQFRVTTSGFSAVIDAGGGMAAASRMGERTLVVGEVSVPTAAADPSLVVAWGDWVGQAAAALLVLLLAAAAWPRAQGHRAPVPVMGAAIHYTARVSVLPAPVRIAAGVLRVVARVALLGLGVAVLLGEASLAAKPLAQLRLFAALVLAPEAAAWLLLRAYSATLSLAQGELLLLRGGRRLAQPVGDITEVTAWTWPLPSPGATLALRSASPSRLLLSGADPLALAAALAAAGAPLQPAAVPSRAGAYAHACLATRRGPRLAHPFAKFVLLPLVLAIPAFRLHQQIAYGGSFGEYHSYGLQAYLTTFALWWAGWVIGVAWFAALLGLAIDAATWALVLRHPVRAPAARRHLERIGLAVLYLGLPAWLLLRLASP
jgi:apolipoprotein N-acyltransferase